MMTDEFKRSLLLEKRGKHQKYKRKLAPDKYKRIHAKEMKTKFWLLELKLGLEFILEEDLYILKPSNQFSKIIKKIIRKQSRFANQGKSESESRITENVLNKTSPVKNDGMKRKCNFKNDAAVVIKKPRRNGFHPDAAPSLSLYRPKSRQIYFLHKDNTVLHNETKIRYLKDYLAYLGHNKKHKTQYLEEIISNLDELKGIDKSSNEPKETFSKIKIMQKDHIKPPIVDAYRIFPFLEDYLKKWKRKQYAFTVAVMKESGNIIVLSDIEPYFYNKSSFHSEELLCIQMDIYLRLIGPLVENIFIFTFHCPCMKCLSLLAQCSHAWYREYGFVTTVGFTENWGFGRAFSNSITFSPDDMLGPSGVFYEYRERHRHEVFKLSHFKLQSPIFQLVKKVRRDDRRHCREQLKSCQDALANLSENPNIYTLQQHEQHGKEIIFSCQLPPEIRDECIGMFLKDWQTLVYDSAKPNLTQKITKDFNMAVDQVKHGIVTSTSEKNGPLQFLTILKLLNYYK